jgi:sugar phosphate isomerase/epimerase
MKTFIFIFIIISNCVTSVAQRPGVGIVQDMENDSLLHAAGYTCLLESVAKCISPRKVSEQQFQERLMAIRKLITPLYGCNLFIPGELKVVGPAADETAVLAYVEVVFQRCRDAGVGLITWGSGGSRRVPDGFDREQAREQFIATARKIAASAARYKIILALENLNSGETNFITTLNEALRIVKAVDHPNFRLCADLYHMLRENEGPAIIETAGKYLVHCELAEKENRTPPGTKGDDFREYFKMLKKVHYNGKIILECRWENLARQAAPARAEVERQLDDVY